MKKNDNLKELACVYDTRKSFYGKAYFSLPKYKWENNITKLYSYNTLVCEFDNNRQTYKVNGDIDRKLLYSKTTLRHIKEFIKQMLNENINITKKDIIRHTYVHLEW